MIKIDEKCDFDGVSELQWPIKNFLWVQSSYNKYIKCSPRLGGLKRILNYVHTTSQYILLYVSLLVLNYTKIMLMLYQ